MRITIHKNNTTITTNNKKEYIFNLGEKEIQNHGFQVIDHLVENIIPELEKGEEVFVVGETLESKMLSRKIEDKIKREVILVRERSFEHE